MYTSKYNQYYQSRMDQHQCSAMTTDTEIHSSTALGQHCSGDTEANTFHDCDVSHSSVSEQLGYSFCFPPFSPSVGCMPKSFQIRAYSVTTDM